MANILDTSPGAVAAAYPGVVTPDQFAPAYESAARWNRAATGGPIGLFQALFGTVDRAKEAAAYNQMLTGAQGAEQGRLTTNYYDQMNGAGAQPAAAAPQQQPAPPVAPGAGLMAALGNPDGQMGPGTGAPPSQQGLVSALSGNAPPPSVPGMRGPMPSAGGGWGPNQILAGLRTAAMVPGLSKNMPAYITALDTAIKEGKSIGPDGSIYNTPGALPASTLSANAAKGISMAGVNPNDPNAVNAAVAGQAGATSGAQANATNASDLAFKPRTAAATAAATLPYSTMGDLMKPQADRTTGEIMIPWNDPQVRQQYYDGMGMKNPAGQYVAPPDAGTAPAVPAKTPVPFGSIPLSQEVPSVTLPTGLLPKGPGTIIQGRDPVAIKAGEQAVDQANEQYKGMASAASAANAIKAQIGTMRAEVQKGTFDPSASTPARYLIAGFLNASMGPAVAQQVTGLDPAAGDVMNKEGTRMGLAYARQTEGAREAVAGINIALKGNPQIGGTKKGYLDILNLIDAGADHDLGGQATANAMFQKNGNYVGAKEFYDANHPPAEFTSKVVPYNVPATPSGAVDPTQLQPNVTYNLTSKNYTGPAVWTGNGFKPAAK